MISGERRRRAVVAVVALTAVVTTAAAIAYDRPRVVEMESEFGEVREEGAEVNTRIVVRNPNNRAIPGRLNLGYTVRLNDVVVATGVERGVRLKPGRNTIETSAVFDNSKIPEWWVTHVNNGENSTMTTTARVGVVGSFGPTIPAEERAIATDLVGPLAENESSTVRLGENDVLVVGNQSAEWGEADGERTPIRFSTELENVHDRPVRLDGTDYEVRMNGIVVGEGETSEGVELAPGESTTFEIEAAIDTPKMEQWWVSHLRNEQSTDLRIDVYAVTDDGETRKRLPITVFERHATFDTDLLGTGETSVTVLEGDPPEEFAEPRVEQTTSEWGEVRDDETDIRTTVDLVNENDEAFADLLTLEVEQRTTLAGITVAEGTERIEELPRGTGEIEIVTTKPHSVVPEWWAAHLRNGEVSETRTETTGEADVAVTTLPVEFDDRNSTVETDLLSDLNDDTSQREGQLTIHSTSAEWVDPTAEEATIVVEADIENENLLSSISIREVDYVVDINGVVLADDRAPESHTFDPGERRTVRFTIVLDNSRMEEWWPTHIERGEVSEVNREVVATVESGGETERRELDFLSESQTIETDLLAEE